MKYIAKKISLDSKWEDHQFIWSKILISYKSENEENK